MDILDKLRGQRADNFTEQLRSPVTAAKGNLFFDSFRPESGETDFPLGWTRPEATMKEMDAQVERRTTDAGEKECHNRENPQNA